MTTKERIEALVIEYGREIAEKLFEDDFELIEWGQCTVLVLVDGSYYELWMMNGRDYVNFHYESTRKYSSVISNILAEVSSIPEKYRAGIKKNIERKKQKMQEEINKY